MIVKSSLSALFRTVKAVFFPTQVKEKSLLTTKPAFETVASSDASEDKKDCLFLTSIVWLSVATYVTRIGFYLDDWTFWGLFTNSSDQSIAGYYRALYETQSWTRMRPLQLLYLASLYRLFGLHPLGYHLVNAIVINLVVIFFYLCLRELKQDRLLAIAVPLVYVMLPHYSADRFWIATFQANLSIALYFGSLYLQLHNRAERQWTFQALGIASMVLSILAYEAALPLFLLNLVILLCVRRERHKPLAVSFLILLLVTAVKVIMTERSPLKVAFNQSIETEILRLIDFRYHYYDGVFGLNLKQAIAVNLITLGVGLPRLAIVVIRGYFSGLACLVSLLLSLRVFLYLNRIKRAGNVSWLKMIGLGTIIFAAGYAIFLTTTEIRLTTVDHGNRTNIAAAIGVAFVFVGTIGLIGMLFNSEKPRRVLFSLGVACLCGISCLIVSTTANFWAESYRRQDAIVERIHREFPTIRPGSTLILDGFCPWKGPTIVFRDWEDLEGALQTSYKEPTIHADIVTPRLALESASISTNLFGKYRHYAYADNVLLYNVRERLIVILDSKAMAEQYFSHYNPNFKSAPDPEAARRAFHTFQPEPINECPEFW